MNNKKITIWLIIAFLAGATVTVGIISATPIGKIDKKILQIQTLAKGNYLYKQDVETLVENTCKGYVEGLNDKYSAYMTKEEYETWEKTLTGNYSGIGVSLIQKDNDTCVILNVLKKSPADKAGIKAGDKVIAIDGKQCKNADMAAALLKGPSGEKIKIKFKHNKKTRIKTLTRTDIKQSSVEFRMLDKNVAYISINAFVEDTGKDVRKALTKAKSKNAKALVLDLRNNGGGLFEECVKVANNFISKDTVCYIKDKDGKETKVKTKTKGKTNLRTIVLVNENTVSAGEILAAALKDHGYKLIGQNTFGKGVMQNTFKLKDGSAVKLTVKEVISPHKHKINDKGIRPNLVVENPDENIDKQLQIALSEVK